MNSHAVLKMVYLISLFHTVLLLGGDSITIYNRTEMRIYVAPYYKRGLVATRYADYQVIEPGGFLECERPSYKIDDYFTESNDIKFGYDRKLYITRKPYKLKATLSRNDRKHVASLSIGFTQGTHFYIAQVNGRLKGFNSLEWKIIRPIIEAGEQFVKETIQTVQYGLKKVLPAVRHNKYKKINAVVRSGNQLCAEEWAYLNIRKQRVKKTLEKNVGFSIDNNRVPTISIVASGGGFRAMLATIGYLHALEQMGLLDAVTYISSLSGSTWAVGTWFALGATVSSLRNMLTESLAPGLFPLTPQELRYFVDMLLTKWAFDQPITLVDFYGALVGNRLLELKSKLRHRCYLSDQAELLATGMWPLPIYTAVHSGFRIQNEWYEFTPYEIGGAWLGHYVPSWGYGRRFENGHSIDYAPEQSLSTHFGVFGAAFSATFNRMYNEIAYKVTSPLIKKIIERILSEIGNQRLTNSCFNNFTFGMYSSPIGTYNYIELADAGVDFNLPYPPISEQRPERASDIIIFLDISSTIKGVPALRGAASYAHRHGLSFPAIDKASIDQRACTVLKDNYSKNAPTVIYMPWIKDENLWREKKQLPMFSRFIDVLDQFEPGHCLHSFCDTLNFEYSRNQANKVVSLAEFNMLACKEVLLNVINERMNAH